MLLYFAHFSKEDLYRSASPNALADRKGCLRSLVLAIEVDGAACCFGVSLERSK